MKEKKDKKVLKLEELSWKQIDNLERDRTLFFLPISPLEEHGPHLPVGTDILITKEAANEAIKILNKRREDLNYILLPTITLGFCKFNTDFPGSISSKVKTISDVIYDIGVALADHGFKYMIICNYHMAIAHLRGIYSAMKKLEKKGLKTCEPLGPFFYTNQIEKNEPKLGFDTSREIHACFRETSLMKYLYPYLVDESYKNLQNIYRDLYNPRNLGKKFKDLGLKDGYVGSPARADADYGRWLFSKIVETIANAAIDLYEGKEQPELPKNIKRAMNAMFWY